MGLLARLVDSADASVDPVVVLSYGAAGAYLVFQAVALYRGEVWQPMGFGGGLAAILSPMVPGLFRKPPEKKE